MFFKHLCNLSVKMLKLCILSILLKINVNYFTRLKTPVFTASYPHN